MNNKLLAHNRNRNKLSNQRRPEIIDKNVILNTEKIDNTNNNLDDKLNKLQTEYNVDINKYWKSRTNEPYKVIFKNINNKEYKTQDDLIVHKVTQQDKQGIDDEYDKRMADNSTHNNELKRIFADDKKQEHYKKFEYNNCYKYRNTQDNTNKDFIDMKSVIKEENTNQKTVDIPDIMNNLINTGMLETNNNINNKSNITIIKRK